MKIHDISRLVRAGIPVWPGDTDFDFGLVAKIAEGSSCNVGRVEMSVHTGTHIDAPLHFDDAGADAASVPLERYVGPCVVADVRPDDRGILPEHLPPELDEAARTSGRVLLRSYATRPDAFDQGMAHATPELADWLAARGVLLLGIDTDSMDAFESKELPAHHRLNHHGIAILEGIDLSKVGAGHYELIALPLRIEGADGSPVRAVLVEREE
ncbi:MAG: cyclase family protein [Planctomycetota bacterium]|nr:cyclase family protein [Planctomycetota bacterium]